MEPNAVERLTIKSWAEADRPREKFLIKGRSSLSDAELLAILIGSGNRNESAVELGRRILDAAGNDLHRLGRYSVADLMKFHGMGEARSLSILAALELGRRRAQTEPAEMKQIVSSAAAAALLRAELADLNIEEFWIVCLNRANKVLGKYRVSSGGMTGTVADAKVIFRIALENQAVSILLFHNHPSGNLKPSEADIKLTRRLKQAGEAIEIAVLDHIIIASGGFFSLADENLL